MSHKYISTEVEVSLDEWDDKEIIEEVKARGYKVEEEEGLIEAQWRWRRGDKKEALIILEREFKWLRGISELAN
jgi:hypothetical protein